MTNFIDDTIGQATRSQAEPSFNSLYDLQGELGLDISKKKLVYPSTQASCLGVLINTENFTISLMKNWQKSSKCARSGNTKTTFSLYWVDCCMSPNVLRHPDPF